MEGQQWYDGCDLMCRCEDAKSGFYRCQQRPVLDVIRQVTHSLIISPHQLYWPLVSLRANTANLWSIQKSSCNNMITWVPSIGLGHVSLAWWQLRQMSNIGLAHASLAWWQLRQVSNIDLAMCHLSDNILRQVSNMDLGHVSPAWWHLRQVSNINLGHAANLWSIQKSSCNNMITW
jgi:hypothetical protein